MHTWSIYDVYMYILYTYRLGPIKASHCNLPLPRITQSEKYVSLFVPNTTKSEPFGFPWGGNWYTGWSLYRSQAGPWKHDVHMRYLYIYDTYIYVCMIYTYIHTYKYIHAYMIYIWYVHLHAYVSLCICIHDLYMICTSTNIHNKRQKTKKKKDSRVMADPNHAWS